MAADKNFHPLPGGPWNPTYTRVLQPDGSGIRPVHDWVVTVHPDGTADGTCPCGWSDSGESGPIKRDAQIHHL